MTEVQATNIIAYEIISCRSTIDLEKYVNTKILEGWQPFYTPFTYPGDSYSQYVNQAMVKYGKLRKLNKDEIR